MKYNLKAIMQRAWQIKNLNKSNDFGICLSIAWQEHKHINSQPSFTVEFRVAGTDWQTVANYNDEGAAYHECTVASRVFFDRTYRVREVCAA